MFGRVKICQRFLICRRRVVTLIKSGWRRWTKRTTQTGADNVHYRILEL